MSHVLDGVRFEPERVIIDRLFEQYGLEDHIQHWVSSGEAAKHVELVMSTQLRLTPLLAPRLSSLLAEVRATLQFEPPVDLFVAPDASINAFAVHSLAADSPHVVSLTSGMVERMTDPEIRFVLGHELGHLHYQHYRSLLVSPAIGEDEEGASRMPPLLTVRLASWDRLAELSADRAGFVAVGGDLDTIVSVFFKLASGLGPEHLRFDIQAFLAQLADLQKMKRREVIAAFSHPVTPVRVRALQLFSPFGRLPLARKQLKELAKVDAEVREITRLLDFEVTEPLEVHARDFLLAAGTLAGRAAGEDITGEQWEVLMTLLLPLTQDPEAHIERLTNADAAEARLVECAAWLKENALTQRFELFGQLAHIVAIDGRLHPGETTFMDRVAGLLGIPDKEAHAILYEVLAGYLQTRSGFKPTPRG